jgi:hypothetical protein
MHTTIKLGSEVVVSDPCYEIPTWCQAVIDGVLPGNYKATVLKQDEGDWGTRCSKIIAIHEDYNYESKFKWTYYPASIGVDSGQCGIFSKESYRDDSHQIEYGDGDISFFNKEPWASMGGKKDSGEDWYVKMCSRTLGEQHWGVYDEGVVSSSGYGDGSYNLYVARKKKKIVGFIVEFLYDENRRPLKKIVEEEFFQVQY